MTKKIIFHSNKHYNKESTVPITSRKTLPKWWEDSDTFVKDPLGNPVANFNGEGKMFSFKALHACHTMRLRIL